MHGYKFKVILLFCLCLIFGLEATAFQRLLYNLQHLQGRGQLVHVALKRGDYTILLYKAKQKIPLAIIIFGSGDGGWGSWENKVSSSLSRAGYEVVGIDSAKYAATPYDLQTLQADYCTIANKFLAPYGATPPPVVVGGWSMGAAQAIAVAGGPQPPSQLKAIVVASPLSRGRFGLQLADKLNILPTGPGTFAVDDFAPTIKGLRLVQWHGVKDTIDSRAWLRDVTIRYREYDLPNAGHTYNDASDTFVERFLGSVRWALQEPSAKDDARRS